MADQKERGGRRVTIQEDNQSSDASSADYEVADWDGIEEQSMRALEEQLAQLKPESCDATGHASSSSSSGPLRNDLVQLQQACSREPYRPEDHVLTSEEMWAGFSSDEGEVEPSIEDPHPRTRVKSHSSAEEGVAASSAKPDEQASSNDARAASSRYADTFASTASEIRQPSMDKSADVITDPGKLLEAACKEEPYNPEDHQLTAEEFWGGSSASSDNGKHQVEPESKAKGCPPKDNQNFTAEEMWAGWSDDEAAATGSGEADAAQPASSSSSSSAALAAETRRLSRMLAGREAATRLADLDPVELEAVADDCMQAVETLRWVLRRQRQLARGSSAS